MLIVFFLLLFIVVLVVYQIQQANQENIQKNLFDWEKEDSTWSQERLLVRIKEVFLAYYSGWSQRKPEMFRSYLTPRMYDKTVFELEMLRVMGRQNTIEGLRLLSSDFVSVVNLEGDDGDCVKTAMWASADDELIDDQQRVLYNPATHFSEYWIWKKSQKEWKLDAIQLVTENSSVFDPSLKTFADEHGFFFDLDFGWHLLPSATELFPSAGFGTADINNHVMGRYRGMYVQFYHYVPNYYEPMSVLSSGFTSYAHHSKKAGQTFVVAHIILPKKYAHFLITSRLYTSISSVTGLEIIETESIEFNKRFSVQVATVDRATVFELLTPSFMEHVASLPFELSFELFGSSFILVSPYSTISPNSQASYKAMLDVLTKAFDEMKM